VDSSSTPPFELIRVGKQGKRREIVRPVPLHPVSRSKNQPLMKEKEQDIVFRSRSAWEGSLLSATPRPPNPGLEEERAAAIKAELGEKRKSFTIIAARH